MGRRKTNSENRLTERAWQRQVIDYARLRGWLLYHHRPALRPSGNWSTALTGAPGMPDLILARGQRLVFAELKTQTGRVSDSQKTWLAALEQCPVEVYLWRPSDWETVRAILL